MNRLVRASVLTVLSLTTLSTADEPVVAVNPPEFSRLATDLTGATLVGSFTQATSTPAADDAETEDPKSANAADQTPKLRAERYEIRRVKKLDQGDFWIIEARIVYGERDVTIPVPVEIKWAGSTPVITLDSVPIPGLGTFDARVLISGEKYAGTWSHDDVGGHLFGRIEKEAMQESE